MYSPKTRHHAAKEKHAVALDKGREEGEEAIDRHGYQQALFTAHLVWQAAPEKGSKHHSQIHNATCRQGDRQGTTETILAICSQLFVRENAEWVKHVTLMHVFPLHSRWSIQTRKSEKVSPMFQYSSIGLNSRGKCLAVWQQTVPLFLSASC